MCHPYFRFHHQSWFVITLNSTPDKVSHLWFTSIHLSPTPVIYHWSWIATTCDTPPVMGRHYLWYPTSHGSPPLLVKGRHHLWFKISHRSPLHSAPIMLYAITYNWPPVLSFFTVDTAPCSHLQVIKTNLGSPML